VRSPTSRRCRPWTGWRPAAGGAIFPYCVPCRCLCWRLASDRWCWRLLRRTAALGHGVCGAGTAVAPRSIAATSRFRFFTDDRICRPPHCGDRTMQKLIFFRSPRVRSSVLGIAISAMGQSAKGNSTSSTLPYVGSKADLCHGRSVVTTASASMLVFVPVKKPVLECGVSFADQQEPSKCRLVAGWRPSGLSWGSPVSWSGWRNPSARFAVGRDSLCRPMVNLCIVLARAVRSCA